MKKKTLKKDPNVYPPGWDAARVRRVLDHYENQSDEEAAAEDDAAAIRTPLTLMKVPVDLAPKVRALIAKHKAGKVTSRKNGHKRKRAA